MGKGNRFSIFSEGAEAEVDDIPVVSAQPVNLTPAPAAQQAKPAQKTKPVKQAVVKAKAPGNSVSGKVDSVSHSVLSRDGEVSSLDTYFVDFDVEGFGFEVYKKSTASHRISIISRLSIGTIAAVMAFVGTNRIMQIVNSRKPKIGYDKKRVAGAAKKISKNASRFAYYSGKARSTISRIGMALKGAPKSVPLWILSAGTGVVSSVTITKDIGQWFADAISDWQQTFKYNFNQNFSSSDFARLNAILVAGQEAKYQKDRNGLGIAISGRDIKLLSILASTKVMDAPLDIRTSAIIADTLKTVLDKYKTDKSKSDTETFDSLLSKVRMTIYVGDPENTRASSTDLQQITTEFRQLLLKFSRSIEDITEWDNEDVLVPIILIANRFTKIPGVLSKILTNSFAFGEVALTKTFDEDTQELVAQIDAANNLNRNDSGFFEYLKNFVLYHLGFNMDGQSGEVVPDESASTGYESLNIGGI